MKATTEVIARGCDLGWRRLELATKRYAAISPQFSNFLARHPYVLSLLPDDYLDERYGMVNSAYASGVATLPPLTDRTTLCARALLVKWLDVATGEWPNALTEHLATMCDFNNDGLALIEQTLREDLASIRSAFTSLTTPS